MFLKKLMLALFIILGGESAYAAIDFSKCWTWGDINQKNFYTIYAINKQCSDYCYTNCVNNFSVLDSNQNEINKDLIYQCIESCQNGNNYIGAKRLSPDGSSVTTSVSACNTDDPQNPSYPGVNYLKTDITFPANSTQQISIILSSTQTIPTAVTSGQLYMCGIQYAYLNPLPYSANACDYLGYTNSTIPPAVGPCKCQGSNCNASIQPNSTAGQWSVVNNDPTNLNMPIIAGDKLDIKMSGIYLHDCTINTNANSAPVICNQQSDSYNLQMYYDPTFSGEYSNSSSYYSLPGSSVKLAEVDDGIQNAQASFQMDLTYEANWPTFMGLKSNAQVNTNSTVLPSISSSNITFFNKQKIVEFSGVVDNSVFGANYFVPLMIKHPASGNVANSLGGLNIEIERNGCYENDGRSIQYLVLDNSKPEPDGSETWNNVPFSYVGSTKSNVANITVAATNASTLFLKVTANPELSNYIPSCATTGASDCQLAKNLATKYVSNGNNGSNFSQYGSYTVQVVQPAGQPSLVQQMFKDALQQFLGLFYGNVAPGEYATSSPGLVQATFLGLVTDTGIHSFIVALLVLYVAWTGASYMLGTAPLNQQDAAIRIFKFAIVTLLLSPSAWDFFYNNFLAFFMQGSFDLLAIIVTNSNAMFEGGNAACKLPEGSVAPFDVIFCIFNEPIQVLTSPMIWARVLACLMSSFLGFVVAIIMLIAMVIYFVTIFNVLIMFLLSIVIISLLMMLSPLFITFILFSYTRSFFDEWIKMLFNYFLQMPLIFLGIAVLNDIVLAGVESVLTFPICSSCFLPIYIPIYGQLCIMPGYVSIRGLESAAGSLSLPVNLESIIFLIVIIHGMRHIPNMVTEIVNRISGFYAGFSLSRAASDAYYSARNVISQATGGDVTGFTPSSMAVIRKDQLKSLEEFSKYTEEKYVEGNKELEQQNNAAGREVVNLRNLWAEYSGKTQAQDLLARMNAAVIATGDQWANNAFVPASVILSESARETERAHNNLFEKILALGKDDMDKVDRLIQEALARGDNNAVTALRLQREKIMVAMGFDEFAEDYTFDPITTRLKKIVKSTRAKRRVAINQASENLWNEYKFLLNNNDRDAKGNERLEAIKKQINFNAVKFYANNTKDVYVKKAALNALQEKLDILNHGIATNSANPAILDALRADVLDIQRKIELVKAVDPLQKTVARSLGFQQKSALLSGGVQGEIATILDSGLTKDLAKHVLTSSSSKEAVDYSAEEVYKRNEALNAALGEPAQCVTRLQNNNFGDALKLPNITPHDRVNVYAETYYDSKFDAIDSLIKSQSKAREKDAWSFDVKEHKKKQDRYTFIKKFKDEVATEYAALKPVLDAASSDPRQVEAAEAKAVAFISKVQQQGLIDPVLVRQHQVEGRMRELAVISMDKVKAAEQYCYGTLQSNTTVGWTQAALHGDYSTDIVRQGFRAQNVAAGMEVDLPNYMMTLSELHEAKDKVQEKHENAQRLLKDARAAADAAAGAIIPSSVRVDDGIAPPATAAAGARNPTASETIRPQPPAIPVPPPPPPAGSEGSAAAGSGGSASSGSAEGT